MTDGLSSMQAFTNLENEIESELQNYKLNRKSWLWLFSAYSHKNIKSVLHWIGILFILLFLIILVISINEERENKRYSLLIIDFIIITSLLLCGLVIVGFNSYLTHNEMCSIVENIVHEIKEFKRKCNWEAENYPDLEVPFSPAINLQWTYRDKNLVNLPTALLVKDDVIVLHPGQKTPAKCISIESNTAIGRITLNENEIYCPDLESNEKETFSTPRVKKPLKDKKFLLQETPYRKNIRLALIKSLNRPPTLFEKEQHLIKGYYIERITIPIIFILVLALNAFRYFYLKVSFGDFTEMILLQPFYVILPLLPLKFPIYYHFLNLYGICKIISVYSSMLNEPLKIGSQSLEHTITVEFMTQTSQVKLTKWLLFKKLFFGKPVNGKFWLFRTSNVLHTFGSMTSLCCVDKKGILSWPNPTAEKIFFFKNPSNTPEPSNESLYKTSASKLNEMKNLDNLKDGKHYGDLLTPNDSQSIQTGHHSMDQFYYSESKVEVLDLTHNNRLPFALQFDDPHWRKYLASLKPLGLNILLNTCNPESQPQYINFCSYLAREALSNEITIPAINRRCLCELSKQIGFMDSAAEVFQFEQQLSFFRHVQEDIVRQDKLTRSLDVKKLKCAMPNAISIITKDLLTGSPQLMSQGTADILVDLCSEYWDGSDLLPITHTERKKILDFYHRYSLTAYCTAFAYRPITAPVNDQYSSVYLELPPNYNQFFHHSFSSSPMRLKPQHYLSTDSIFLYENTEQISSDPEMSLKQISNQIFIGMVAMQYQARTDIVRLIERLDDACIRFVHFSKENELRSRVFSEKMGLESGWNCHISLLSDSDSKLSLSQGLCTKQSLNSISNKLDSMRSSKKQFELIDFTDMNIKVQRSHSAPIGVHYEVDTTNYLSSSPKENSIQYSLEKMSENMSSALQSSTIKFSDEDNSQALDNQSLESFEADEASNLLSESIKLRISNADDKDVEIISVDETDSSDQSDDVGFDMSNRAKLPKGIENIRPHLEKIDNVPLLVSLFTDCTPQTTHQMIEIMQEHDEVICCIGSVANFHNMSVFLQSDASIGVQPLYPQICMKKPVIKKRPAKSNVIPTKMSAILNSIACVFNYHRDTPFDVYQLIIEAKHYMLCMRSCFYLMLSFFLTITSVQLVANILLLPPILTGSHILWLTCFIIPTLCLSIPFSSTDPHIMNYAAGRLVWSYDKQAISLFSLCYLTRFFPTILTCLLCFGLSFEEMCQDKKSPQLSCHLFTGYLNQTEVGGIELLEKSYRLSLYTTQSLVTFCLALYFALTSVSFVHRYYPIWKKSILKNPVWIISFVVVIVAQLVYTGANLAVHSESKIIFHHIPFYVWILIALWALLVIPVNELVKLYEIRVNVRLQKKARLEFGTKLGMNSPF